MKIQWQHLKLCSSKTTVQIITKFGTKHTLAEGIQGHILSKGNKSQNNVHVCKLVTRSQGQNTKHIRVRDIDVCQKGNKQQESCIYMYQYSWGNWKYFTKHVLQIVLSFFFYWNLTYGISFCGYKTESSVTGSKPWRTSRRDTPGY